MYADFTTRVTQKDLPQLLEVERLAWATPGENMAATQDKIARRIPEEHGTQSVVLASVNGEAAGSQYAFRFNWDRDISKLASWDEYTRCGWTHLAHSDCGETGFLVGVGVVPRFRGLRVDHNLRWKGRHKISEMLIAITLDNLFLPDSGKGVTAVIANARIPFYHRMPQLSVFEYCEFRRDDDLLYDPVLRFHERMGARLIKPVAYSMEDAESLNGGCWVLYSEPFGGF